MFFNDVLNNGSVNVYIIVNYAIFKLALIE